ncbi:MAG: penicillin-binding transpeptidase domain-containing protein [Phycisphaerae bacterium]
MYEKRLKAIIIIFAVFLAVALLRLCALNLYESGEAREKIASTGVKAPEVLPTLRGTITDRNGEFLAVDSPVFELGLRYKLARLRDERFWHANALIRAESKGIPLDVAQNYWAGRLAPDIEMLEEIIQLASQYSSLSERELDENIAEINDGMWHLRRYFAWKRNFPGSESIADFDSLPDEQRLMMEAEVNDLWEMKNKWFTICELQEENIYAAQSSLSQNPEALISTSAKRKYPFGSTAAQIIGWVNPSRPDKELFEEDELISYIDGETAGFYGTEYVCEPFLRGSRGKLIFHSRKGEPEQQARELGDNIRLSLDIKLQRMLEERMANPSLNANAAKTCCAVVIDVSSGEILAAVSEPGFDLSRARQDYGKLINDKAEPLRNKAFEKLYPPGSTVKPLILAAALTDGAVNENTIISCSLPADENWPRCWLQRAYGCHDDQFADVGGNTGVNAIRGSCNIYFTKAAHRMDARSLQKHLFDAGLGREVLAPIDFSPLTGKVDRLPDSGRHLNAERGIIWSGYKNVSGDDFDLIPKLNDSEKRWFGMGQGNLRVTVLQMANFYAAIARGGIYRDAILYKGISVDNGPRDLGWNAAAKRNVREGTRRVVNEVYGSAYKIFHGYDLFEKGVHINGKTGSTQGPENAWFAGFAEKNDLQIAIAVIVEGGQSGTQDGAPLGKLIFSTLDDCGYFD